METPIFQTQKTGKKVSVLIFKDKLKYINTLDPIFGTKEIPLDQIEQVAFAPKEPGSDPRTMDLALRISGKTPTVIKGLDIAEAKQIQDILKKYRLEKPQMVAEQHPFTRAGRAVQASMQKENAKKTQLKKPSPTGTLPRLPFRGRSF